MADFIQNGGSSGGTYASYYTGKLSVWENSYDVSSNSSNVGYRLQLISGSSGRFSGLNASYSVSIDGVVRNSGSGSYSLGHNGVITLCEGNFTVWHNEDGRKSVWCSAGIDFQSHTYSPGDFYPSGNLDLSTIPRASSIFCTTANIEETAMVTIASASNAFRHSVYAYFGSQYVVIAENQGGGNFPWTIPFNFYNEIPNSKSGTGTIVCETFNNGVLLGSKSAVLTVTTNEEKCKPTIDASIVDVNPVTTALTEDNSKLVKHKSIAKVTISSNAKNGSSIASKKVNDIVVEGDTASIQEIETDIFTVTVIDSRGYSNSVVLKPTIIDYIPLSINAIIKRTQPTTGEVDIEFSGNYYNNKIGNANNELTIKWFYREKGTTEWISGGNILPETENNTYSNGSSKILLGKIFNYQKSYEFYLEVADKLSTLTPQFVVTQGIPIFNWGKDFVNINTKLLINELDVKGTMLYENEEGTQNNITLSQSVTDFDIIEIIFKRDTGYFSARYRDVNGKNVVATSSYYNFESMFLYSSQLFIEDKTINYKNHGLCWLDNKTKDISVGNDDNVKIVAVFGY